jgi:hypothetical protein
MVPFAGGGLRVTLLFLFLAGHDLCAFGVQGLGGHRPGRKADLVPTEVNSGRGLSGHDRSDRRV